MLLTIRTDAVRTNASHSTSTSRTSKGWRHCHSPPDALASSSHSGLIPFLKMHSASTDLVLKQDDGGGIIFLQWQKCKRSNPISLMQVCSLLPILGIFLHSLEIAELNHGISVGSLLLLSHPPIRLQKKKSKTNSTAGIITMPRRQNQQRKNRSFHSRRRSKFHSTTHASACLSVCKGGRQTYELDRWRRRTWSIRARAGNFLSRLVSLTPVLPSEFPIMFTTPADTRSRQDR
eukprot:SAG31_NODE_600_length_13647_cov_3.894376_13_plen_233_part_00